MIAFATRATGRRILAALVALTAFSGGVALAAGDAAAGKPLYAVCVACHGANGEGNKALMGPRLVGQEAWYLKRQIQLFKDGARGSHPQDTAGKTMRPMAMTLATPAAVDNVIAYIGTLDAPPAAATVTGDVAKGKAAYVVCGSCHGQKAEGIVAMNAPRLAGQNDWYLVTQLKNYKAGIRGQHPKDVFGKQMAPMANMLTDDAAINNVVAYINSLD